MTKKGHHKFWRMKMENFFSEKVKFRKVPWESEKCLEIVGKYETEGNVSLHQRGMDAPGIIYSLQG